MKAAVGNLEIWSDHKNIVDAFASDLRHTSGKANTDVWSELLDELQVSHYKTRVRWAPSHIDKLAEGPHPDIPVTVLVGNDEADKLADEEAARHQVPKHEADKAVEENKLASAVFERITISHR